MKKVCYKVSLCENCQRQSGKAFIGLSIRTKMIGGGRPLLRENLTDTDPPPSKTPIFNLFLLGGLQSMQSVQNLYNNLRQLQNGTK